MSVPQWYPGTPPGNSCSNDAPLIADQRRIEHRSYVGRGRSLGWGRQAADVLLAGLAE